MKGKSTCHIFSKEGQARFDNIAWDSKKLTKPEEHGMPTGKQVEHRTLLHSLTHRNGTNIKD